MKPILDYVIRLYPKAWRARYGTELEALLEDMKPNNRDLANVAAVVAMTMRDRYISKAVMRVTGSGDILAKPEKQVLSRTSLSSIMMSYGYTKRASNAAAGGCRRPDAQKRYSDPDPEIAKLVTEELVGRFQDELLRSGTPNFDMLDQACLPTHPFYPNRLLICVLGLASGSIAGLGLAGAPALSRKRLNHA